MNVPVLNLPRDLAAPVPRVWRALTDPAIVARWWGPDGFSAEVHTWELAAGGSYRVRLTGPEGRVHVVGGVFTSIEPTDRLGFTWAWEDEPGWTSEVTLVLEPTPTGTRLHLSHAGLPTDTAVVSHTWGWTGALAKLVGMAALGLEEAA